MVIDADTGRANQKKRTRMAIVAACREIIRSGAPVTMPEVARAALVSEATAYRYFPDLPALLNEAFPGMWPSPAEALAPVADSADPVERVAFACEFLLRGVLAYQGAVRAMIAATIVRPELAPIRPGLRFGLIDQALDPAGRLASGHGSGWAGSAQAGPGRGGQRGSSLRPDRPGRAPPGRRGRQPRPDRGHRHRGCLPVGLPGARDAAGPAPGSGTAAPGAG